MTRNDLQYTLAYIFREAGLMACPRCYRDVRLILAVFAGIIALWLIHDWVPLFSSTHLFQWKLLLSVLIWQPIIEELLFRGIIQGRLSKYAWGQQAVLKITAANLVTSCLFVTLHMVANPPLWSLTIFIPSLLFGYFRDTLNSVYPSMMLHSVYNAIVIHGLIIHGNLLLKPLFL